ncbi:antitoxin [Streptosporangium fragile]
MSIFGSVKDLPGENSGRIEKIVEQGIGKAGQSAGEKAGGQHDRHITTAARKAGEMADKIDDRPGTTPVTGHPDTTPAPDPSGTASAHDQAGTPTIGDRTDRSPAPDRPV